MKCVDPFRNIHTPPREGGGEMSRDFQKGAEKTVEIVFLMVLIAQNSICSHLLLSRRIAPVRRLTKLYHVLDLSSFNGVR